MLQTGIGFVALRVGHKKCSTVSDFLFDVHFSNLVSEGKVQKFKVRADGFILYSF